MKASKPQEQTNGPFIVALLQHLIVIKTSSWWIGKTRQAYSFQRVGAPGNLTLLWMTLLLPSKACAELVKCRGKRKAVVPDVAAKKTIELCGCTEWLPHFEFVISDCCGFPGFCNKINMIQGFAESLQHDSSNQSEIAVLLWSRLLFYIPYFLQIRNGLGSSVFKLCCEDSAKPCTYSLKWL